MTGETYARYFNSTEGSGVIGQLWVLTVVRKPGNEYHHATVDLYIGRQDTLLNGKIPTGNNDRVLRDEHVSGWNDVPEHVQEELACLVPDGTEVLDGDGGEVTL
jgi:hypothetical protein